MKKILILLTVFPSILLLGLCSQVSDNETIVINKSNSPFIITEDLIVPKNSQLIIEKGAEIILSDSVNIFIYGKLSMNGTKKNPIIIKSNNDTVSWGRIIIKSEKNANIEYVNFINGAITSYNSGVYLSNSKFEFIHTRKIDGYPIVYFINSKTAILNCIISNKIDKYVGEGINCIGGNVECVNNTIKNVPDAIEVTRVTKSKIAGNTIQNCFDDAIDLNASHDVDVCNNLITNTEDKGISVGGDQSFNDSVKFGKSFNINIKNNFIYRVKIGVSVSDSSQIKLESNNICNSKIGIKLHQKNKFYGGAFAELNNNILFQNEKDLIVENSQIINTNTLSSYETELSLDTNEFYIFSKNKLDNSSFFRLNKIDSTKILSENNLPKMFINTFPKIIHTDEKTEANFQVFDNKTKLNSDQITIKIRGSSSVEFPKKSYEFETSKLQSILNLPDENDWVLYGPSIDKTLLRNAFAYSVGQKLNIKSPQFKFLNLYVNGENYGLYLLIQKIKLSKEFLNIEELLETDVEKSKISGGYIFKIDKGTGANNWQNLCVSEKNELANYYIHYPKPKNLNQIQKEYITNYIKNFESKISKNPIDINSIDVESFVDYIIVNELMKNFDAYRASLYFHKFRNSENVFLGPIWDFDISSGLALYNEFNTHEGFVFEIKNDFRKYIPLWWYNLISDEQFSNLIKHRWFELRKNDLSDIQLSNLFVDLDSQIKIFSNEKESKNLQLWILNRAKWLDKNIETIDKKALIYR